MKDPVVLTIDQVVDRLHQFDAILDARSPSEHAEDHLPGALNTPVLDDGERAHVGTLHKQVSPFEARRVGAALVSCNISRILQSLPNDLSRDWQPLVYCWRGGNRSGALGTVLARVGWRAHVLEGGYREFRRRVLADLTSLPSNFRYHVLAGRTGSGKSAVLGRLAALGAQVLDLERIARHRGSVLGSLPGDAQPSQKKFESLVWSALRRFDATRPVWVESESKKVGQNHVPDALITAIRASRCFVVATPDQVRADLLLHEYPHFVKDRASLEARLDCLVPLHGHARIEAWKALCADGDWHGFVLSILQGHYDPAYDRSMKRNFTRLSDAPQVALDGADEASVDRLARTLLAMQG